MVTRSEKYPQPVSQSSGCKVSWYTYDNRSDAEQASSAAQEDAVRLSGFGYDFGWCLPGEIREVGGRFIVTIP